MFKPISITSLLALVAFVLFVAGCGGGDDEASGSANGDTASNGPPTRAEFIKEAEAICDRARTDRFYAGPKYAREHRKELNALAPIPAEEKVILAVTLPSVLKVASELEALEPPKGDEQEIDAMIAGIRAGVKKAEKNPYSISLEEPKEYPFREVSKKINRYGIGACRNPA